MVSEMRPPWRGSSSGLLRNPYQSSCPKKERLSWTSIQPHLELSGGLVNLISSLPFFGPRFHLLYGNSYLVLRLLPVGPRVRDFPTHPPSFYITTSCLVTLGANWGHLRRRFPGRDASCSFVTVFVFCICLHVYPNREFLIDLCVARKCSTTRESPGPLCMQHKCALSLLLSSTAYLNMDTRYPH